MDVSEITNGIGSASVALLSIVAALIALSVFVFGAIKVYRYVLVQADRSGGGGGGKPLAVDPWAGYTAEDDARDRAAAGLDDSVGVDPWAGYTAEDDARDRAAAGLPPNSYWRDVGVIVNRDHEEALAMDASGNYAGEVIAKDESWFTMAEPGGAQRMQQAESNFDYHHA